MCREIFAKYCLIFQPILHRPLWFWVGLWLLKHLCCAKDCFSFLRTLAVISQWVGNFWNLYDFDIIDYKAEGFFFVFLVLPVFVLLQKLAYSYHWYCSDQSSALTMECSRKMLSRQLKEEKKKKPLTNILVSRPITLFLNSRLQF